MLKGFRLPLLAAAVALAPASLRADDAAILAKLSGSWVGEWQYDENMKGKLTATFTLEEGKVKGETVWFATAVGDFGDKVQGAKVKGAAIRITESTMDFEGTLSEDGATFKGTWTSPVAQGTLVLKKAAK